MYEVNFFWEDQFLVRERDIPVPREGELVTIPFKGDKHVFRAYSVSHFPVQRSVTVMLELAD